ncbi:MAG: nitrite reductase small subunit NirD [Pseudomonadota bacterium]
MSDQWVEIGRADQIPTRGARLVRIAGKQIGVFKTAGGEVFALDNQCPHKKGPLTEGIVHDTGVTCPLHNWVIDLQSGKARGADEGCVRTYRIDNRDGRLFLSLAE